MKRVYQWDEWLSRPSFTLQKGVHFSCSMSSISQQIRSAASTRGVSVSITEAPLQIDVTVVSRKESSNASTR